MGMNRCFYFGDCSSLFLPQNCGPETDFPPFYLAEFQACVQIVGSAAPIVFSGLSTVTPQSMNTVHLIQTSPPLYRLLLLLCLLGLLRKGAAQPSAPFTFSHLSMSKGLLSNEIRSIAQDRTGYLWIATNNGLQRFDGIHFKTFQRRDDQPGSLPDNSIQQLLIDKEDILWVLFADGRIGQFDKSKFFYTNVPVKVQRTASLWSVKKLLQDEGGNIMFLMESAELLTYDRKNKEFSSAANFIPLKKDWLVSGIAQQPGTQKYWIGLHGGAFAIYNRATGNLSYAGHNIENETAVDSLQLNQGMVHFQFDKHGRFWAVSWITGHYPHIIRYDAKDSKRKVRTYEVLSKLRTYHEINNIYEEKNGRIWIHGNMVFSYFDEARNEFQLVENDSRSGLGIVYDHASALFQDREQNMWVATGNHGLYRFNPTKQYFTSVTHNNKIAKQTGSGSILSFLQLRNGDILAGSWGDGIFRYNSQFQEKPFNARYVSKQESSMFWSMYPSADSNTIWMGCQPGIYQYDQARNTMTHRNPAPLQNRTVRQIAEDRSGNLWLGMHNFGLFKWTSPKLTSKEDLVKIPELGNDLITKIAVDPSGWIWVTAEKKGVFAFDGYSGQMLFHWNNRSEKDSNKIIEGFTNVLPYNDSLVIISTNTRLYQYHRPSHKLTEIPMANSLLGFITSLEKDDEGYLWISTSNGLYRFQMQKKVLVFFNREEGMITDRFVIGASYKLRDGRMLFGVEKAFIYFTPSQIKFPNQHHRVTLSSIQVGRQELPVDSILKLGILTLGPNDNSLNIEFSSLTYNSYSLIQYRLNNIDKDWHSADKDNKASFPFLPPGKYTLMLRTVNAEGQPSEITSLPLLIQAPFYQTWWFYSLLALAMAITLYWLDKQRMRRKAVLQKVRTDIADGLHQEVNTALNNINILSEIARLKSEREPHKAKEYLEQIHNKSHNMIIALDDMLWSLDPENDAMDKTIVRIKEFVDALMQRSGAVIELLIDKRVERLQLNMKLRHEAFLLFKEGLRSLVDAGTSYCIVHMTAERGRLLFTIEFENESCNMQKLNNLLQRHDMEERIDALNAKLDVQLHKSRSVFMLQLPL
jgi:ligand-binding sensor domain-containing protein